MKQIMNEKAFKIATDRLEIVPVSEGDAVYYLEGFNANITAYQYPEPFQSIEVVESFIKAFTALREQGIHLVCSVFNEDQCFVGSVEVHGFDTKAPELGLWICEVFQRRGYAYEVLCGIMGFLQEHMEIEYFIYEADRRNTESIGLAEKLGGIYDGYNVVACESGKVLQLNKYKILKLK